MRCFSSHLLIGKILPGVTQTITERSLAIQNHKVVSHDEWLAARKQLLAKEKECTRLRDQLSKERRELPWERADKELRFRRARRQGDFGAVVRGTEPTG